MLILAVLGQKLKSIHLQLQYGALGLLTLYRVAVVNLHTEVPQYTHVRARLITLPILAAAFYFTAKWAATREDNSNQRIFRGLFALCRHSAHHGAHLLRSPRTLAASRRNLFRAVRCWKPASSSATPCSRGTHIS